METAVLNGFTGAETCWVEVEAFFRALPAEPTLPLLVLPAEQAALWQSRLAAFPLPGDRAAHLLVRSSGSTGEPKWIALSRSSWLAAADAANAHLQAGPADRWGLVLPCFHVGGLAIFARAARAGNPVAAFPGGWRAAAFRDWAEREAITLCSLVPTQVFDLAEAGLNAPAALRAVLTGGGALAPELYREARALGWPLLPSYGMTETASQVATAALGTLAGSNSFPALSLLPIWEAAVPPGGLLKIRGSALASAVLSWSPINGWSQSALTDEAGWFTTRDRVQIGLGSPPWLTFVERADEVVKIRGELVSLSALERQIDVLLLRHPAHRRVALCALPDQRNGHALYLATEVPIEEKMAQSVAAMFPRYAPLEKIVVIDHIPRAALGKVLRPKLLLRVAASFGW